MRCKPNICQFETKGFLCYRNWAEYLERIKAAGWILMHWAFGSLIIGPPPLKYTQVPVLSQQPYFKRWTRGAGEVASGEMFKSSGCSSRGHRFNSQHPHRSSQLSVTPGINTLTQAYKRWNTNAHKVKHQLLKNRSLSISPCAVLLIGLFLL